MRFITVLGILALAVAASEASVLNRLYMSFMAPATTKATTTVRPTTRAPVTTTTTTTTTTTARTTLAPTASAQAETAGPPNPLPADAIDQVLALFDEYTQLQGKEDQVFNTIPNNGPDPLMATIGSLGEDIQALAECFRAVIEAHPKGTPWDLNTEMSCLMPVPVATA